MYVLRLTAMYHVYHFVCHNRTINKQLNTQIILINQRLFANHIRYISTTYGHHQVF
jgi:hypothetical protein